MLLPFEPRVKYFSDYTTLCNDIKQTKIPTKCLHKPHTTVTVLNSFNCPRLTFTNFTRKKVI